MQSRNHECITPGVEMSKIPATDTLLARKVYRCIISKYNDTSLLSNKYAHASGHYDTVTIHSNVAHGAMKYDEILYTFIVVHNNDIFLLLLHCDAIADKKYHKKFIAIANTVYFDD